MSMMLTGAAHSEVVIKKSRFLGCVEPVENREQALKRVLALRRAHPGASHVCWALLAGGESAAVDDGEPGGTAGQPMLNVLRHHDLDGVLATSVRYFGGVKLGAGGLMRAYTDSIAQALSQAEKVVQERMRVLCCELPYELEGLMRQLLDQAGASLHEAQHGVCVRMRFVLPESAAEDLLARLQEPGQGRIRWLDA